jgi:uncharacterized lipoprotein YajG
MLPPTQSTKRRSWVRTLAILAALFGLAACSHTEVLATPTGPVFALNTGHWQASPADLQLPHSGGAE